MKEEITKTEIDRLADLSQLYLTDEEKENLVNEVSGIIDMLKGCDEVDADNCFASSNVVDVDCLRDDVIEESLSRDEMLSMANNVQDGYVVAPKVVD